MPKAVIAIDDWKLPIFKRRLSEAGYQFMQNSGLTAEQLFLTVLTESLADLEVVVRAANTEAQKRRMQ